MNDKTVDSLSALLTGDREGGDAAEVPPATPAGGFEAEYQ
jgi:hypothetical protein